jgi:hypothetical protein
MNLKAFSDADVEVLRRMIARERESYQSVPRNLMPIPRKKIEWKPSESIKWFWLKAPLYPQSDLSPYNDEIWQTTGCPMEWNSETKQWDSVYPETEEIIYSTGNMYAMTDMVIPCQKRDDGWEPVASAPPDNVVLGQIPQLSGDLGSTSNGVQFEETTTTPVDKSGFLRFKTIADRFAYPGSYFDRCIDMNVASPSLDYETDGEIEVLYTGIYEITFAAQILAERYLFASPAGRTSAINTSNASAGTAHTHTYQSPWNGYNTPVKFRPAMWRRPVAGAYAEQTSAAWYMPEISLNILGTSSQGMGYYGRIVQRLEEGETLGLKAYSDQLSEARCIIRHWTLGFHLLQPGWGTIS